MESMLKGEPKEITAPLPETGERHIRYLEDMTPEQREETLKRFFDGIIKEPLDPMPELEPGKYRVHRTIDIGSPDKPALIFKDINNYEAEWVLSL